MAPCLASASARLTATVDLPTPPLPAATAMILAARRPVLPAYKVLETTQDRLAEKEFVARLGIGVAAYADVSSVAGLRAAERVPDAHHDAGACDGAADAGLWIARELVGDANDVARRQALEEPRVDRALELAHRVRERRHVREERREQRLDAGAEVRAVAEGVARRQRDRLRVAAGVVD